MKWQTKVVVSFDAYSNTDQAELITRYPNLIAHLICCSLGYATPRVAANILWNAINDQPEYCEWIACCYKRDARPAILQAIRGRHGHSGLMSSYTQARAIVEECRQNHREPLFGLASWM